MGNLQNSCVIGLGKRTTNGRRQSMLLPFIKRTISFKTKHNSNISLDFIFLVVPH